MVKLKSLTKIMEVPAVYRLWQSPAVRGKFAPVVRNNDISKIRRVLDVGCGPGTNTALFEHADYTGLDINDSYIRAARKRFQRNFVTADARTYTVPPDDRYDFILLNSLLHHIDTDNVAKILAQLAGQLTPDGHVHIIDLVLPPRTSVSRMLAKADRGDYPRPLDEWREIFKASFDEVVFEPFPLVGMGVKLWELVYFKGRAKTQPWPGGTP